MSLNIHCIAYKVQSNVRWQCGQRSNRQYVRSFLAYYGTFFNAISNWQFCLYYILLVVSDIIENELEDSHVVQGRQNGLKNRWTN